VGNPRAASAGPADTGAISLGSEASPIQYAGPWAQPSTSAPELRAYPQAAIEDLRRRYATGGYHPRWVNHVLRERGAP
jgi:hypothetical protein